MAKSRVEVTDRRDPSESQVLDESTLDKRFHYRFVQERPTQISRMRLKGYSLVNPAEEKVRTLFNQEDASAENVIKHGDRVLMKVPLSQHLEYRRQRTARADSRLRANDNKVRQLAKEHGMALHEKDDEEDD